MESAWTEAGQWDGSSECMSVRRTVSQREKQLLSNPPTLSPIFSKWSFFLPQENIRVIVLLSSLYLSIPAPPLTLLLLKAGFWHEMYQSCWWLLASLELELINYIIFPIYYSFFFLPQTYSDFHFYKKSLDSITPLSHQPICLLLS